MGIISTSRSILIGSQHMTMPARCYAGDRYGSKAAVTDVTGRWRDIRPLHNPYIPNTTHYATIINSRSFSTCMYWQPIIISYFYASCTTSLTIMIRSEEAAPPLYMHNHLYYHYLLFREFCSRCRFQPYDYVINFTTVCNHSRAMSWVHFVENTVITILLWSWTVLKHNVSSKPKNCLISSRLRCANKLPRIFAQTNRFKNSRLFSLNNLQCERCYFCVWLCNPAFELPFLYQ